MLETTLPNRNAGTPPPVGEPKLTELISGIMDDAQTLLRQQIDLFKTEVKEEMRQAAQAGKYAVLSVIFLTVAGQALLLAAGFFLAWLLDWPLWVPFLILGVVNLIMVGAFLLVAKQIVAQFNLFPERSLRALKENLTWKA